MPRYLIIQLARLGDLLQTKRLIYSLLYENQKNSEVHLLVDNSLLEFAGLIYPQVQVHAIPAHKQGKEQSAVGLFNQVRGLLEEIGNISFNKVFNLNYSGLNFALAAFFEPGQVAGYAWKNGQLTKGKWAEFAFRWSKNRRQSGLNLMDFWAAYAPCLIEPENVNPLPVPKGGGVGVVLSGRHFRRSLPPQFLAAYSQAALQGLGHGPLILLGTSAEKPLVKNFCKGLKSQFAEQLKDMVGRTSLAELLQIVSNLDVLLTPDTGTMHLAAHLGIPVQAFFLSSAWCFETGVYGKGHQVWQSICDCAPCTEARKCTEDMKCLQAFEHKSVLQVLSQARVSDLPQDLILLESDFDELGVVYKPKAGIWPCWEKRSGFRARFGPFFKQELDQARSKAKEDDFFLERDWMLGD